eukprot:Rhum_TRINITY_DN14340_c21_g1::Rhum_TRINITY_DN14340_c21_g1_i1::g.83658::m.83658
MGEGGSRICSGSSGKMVQAQRESPAGYCGASGVTLVQLQRVKENRPVFEASSHNLIVAVNRKASNREGRSVNKAVHERQVMRRPQRQMRRRASAHAAAEQKACVVRQHKAAQLRTDFGVVKQASVLREQEETGIRLAVHHRAARRRAGDEVDGLPAGMLQRGLELALADVVEDHRAVAAARRHDVALCVHRHAQHRLLVPAQRRLVLGDRRPLRAQGIQAQRCVKRPCHEIGVVVTDRQTRHHVVVPAQRLQHRGRSGARTRSELADADGVVPQPAAEEQQTLRQSHDGVRIRSRRALLHAGLHRAALAQRRRVEVVAAPPRRRRRTAEHAAQARPRLRVVQDAVRIAAAAAAAAAAADSPADRPDRSRRIRPGHGHACKRRQRRCNRCVAAAAAAA